MPSARSGEQLDRDRAVARALDHAASYLRQRLNVGQFAGMDGVYVGYTLCALLDSLAVDARAGQLSPHVHRALLLFTLDLAREERDALAGRPPQL